MDKQSPKSNAERQQDFRDRRKAEAREEIRDALDGAPDHILAVALGEFEEGYEARCLVAKEAYAQYFLYVHQTGLFIVDSDGYYNAISSKDGMRALVQVMDEQRKAIRDFLIEGLTEEQWRSSRYDVARRKLGYPSHRSILEVCKTLESVNAIEESKVVECEYYDMNRYRLMLLENGTIDVNMDPIRILNPEEVRDRRAIRPEEKGRASWRKDAHMEDNSAVDKLVEIIPSHGRALRYLWNLMVTGGEKEAGYLKAIETNAGKSTMLAILQEATGQLGIADRKIMMSGSRFNHLEAMMTKYLLVAIDEADKFEQISPHMINSSINAGRVQLEEKYAVPIVAMRKANLLMVAGGDIQLDWHAQGICPDEDKQGGRFRSMVTMDGKMSAELGMFLNSSVVAEQRQDFLTVLVAYLADPAHIWTEQDREESLNELLVMIGASYLEWQQAMIDTYAVGDEEQWVMSKDIKATIDGAAAKSPSDKAIKQFIEKKFGAVKVRLPRDKGRGMAWKGMTMQQDDQIDYTDGNDVYR